MSSRDTSWLAETQVSYDNDATGYTAQVHGLLERQPHLRVHLDLLAELVQRAGDGPVVDVGCGPGYVTRYLHDSGTEAFGIDLSPSMVEIAQRDHPDLHFEVGSMTNLDLEPDSAAGVVAFWSTIHVPDQAMPNVFAEFHRVVRPGGYVLVGFHVGDGIAHSSRGYTGRAISLDTHLRQPSTISAWLRDADFQVESESIFRPDGDSPGAIVLARKHG